MSFEDDGFSALRTAGNSAEVVSIFLSAIPVAIFFCTILCVLYLFNSLRNAQKRPLRAAIAPLFVLTLRYVMTIKAPLLFEPLLNSSYEPDPKYKIGKKVPVADLHCDAMLWTSGARPLLRTVRHPTIGRSVGSVDLPRLKRGGVRLQVFAAVTSSPGRKMNFLSNERPSLSTDIMTMMAIIEWPIRTYTSTLERALYQAHQLHKNALKSKDQLMVVRDGTQLGNVLSNELQPVAGILAVEGLHVLNERIDNLDILYNAGYRIFGPTHFFDTEVGGSSTGVTKAGLTDFGRNVVRRMKELGTIIDVAHSSETLIEDLLSLSDNVRPPLLLSHTGVREVCGSNRNYRSELIGKLIERDALIGISLFRPSLCGDDLMLSFVRSVQHVVSSFGVDNVCLGSDWDGSVHTAVDAGDVQILAEALRSIGNFSDDDVEKIMFTNAKNFFVKFL